MGILPYKSGFYIGPVHVRLFMEKVALGQVLLLVLYFGCLLSGSLHQCITLIFILIVKCAWWAVCFSWCYTFSQKFVLKYTRKNLEASSFLNYTINRCGRTVCCSDAGGKVATARATHTRQVTAEEHRTRQNVCVGRTPKAFAKFPRGARTDLKSWSSRLSVGHETENFILQKS